MLFTHEAMNRFAKDPAVIRFGGRYYLYFSQRYDDGRFGVGIATSEDLENWQMAGEIPLTEAYEAQGIAAPGAIVLEGKVHLFYQTYGNWKHDAICHAVSEDGLTFTKHPENPIFHPQGKWCSGRAIDADVCLLGDKLLLYFATRDPAMRIQMLGGAWTTPDSGFGRSTWQLLAEETLLKPELPWEGECIEAPAAIVHDGRIYLFYGGSYNCTPQQVGCAVSDDGVHFTRLTEEPLLHSGKLGEWNGYESGHPYVFQDEDGRCYLFYQGSPDNGETWYLSKKEFVFENGMPRWVE